MNRGRKCPLVRVSSQIQSSVETTVGFGGFDGVEDRIPRDPSSSPGPGSVGRTRLRVLRIGSPVVGG